MQICSLDERQIIVKEIFSFRLSYLAYYIFNKFSEVIFFCISEDKKNLAVTCLASCHARIFFLNVVPLTMLKFSPYLLGYLGKLYDFSVGKVNYIAPP